MRPRHALREIDDVEPLVCRIVVRGRGSWIPCALLLAIVTVPRGPEPTSGSTAARRDPCVNSRVGDLDAAARGAQYAAVSLRTASGFLESLRDGREVWLEGERVKDVTGHPRLRGAALTIAALYDMQHDPDLRDRLSVVLDGSGERIGYSHIQPSTRDDLSRAAGTMIKLWADVNGGMLGAHAGLHEHDVRRLRCRARVLRARRGAVRREHRCAITTRCDGRTSASRTPSCTRSAIAPRPAPVAGRGRERGPCGAGDGCRRCHPRGTHARHARAVRQRAGRGAVDLALPARHGGGEAVRRRVLPAHGDARAALHLPEVAHAPRERAAIDYPLSSRMDEMDCVAVVRRRLRPVGALLHRIGAPASSPASSTPAPVTPWDNPPSRIWPRRSSCWGSPTTWRNRSTCCSSPTCRTRSAR